MQFEEITPGPALRPYIKAIYFYSAPNAASFTDIVFPSGNMELIFNMGDGNWKVKRDGNYITNPSVEFWGQVTKPIAVRSVGRNTMLGIRFFPHSAAYFFKEHIAGFNNEILDATDVFGNSIKVLHGQLLNEINKEIQVATIEHYLLNRIKISEKHHRKINFVGDIIKSLNGCSENEKIMSISRNNHISSRYLSQLFSEYTGLAPKLLHKINRFQNSLKLVNNTSDKLTGIAYDAGYFDQSHFIREFKLFTGITPTEFSNQLFPVNQLLAAV